LKGKCPHYSLLKKKGRDRRKEHCGSGEVIDRKDTGPRKEEKKKNERILFVRHFPVAYYERLRKREGRLGGSCWGFPTKGRMVRG